MATSDRKLVIGDDCLFSTSDHKLIRARIVQKHPSGKYKIVILQHYACWHVGDETNVYLSELKPFKPKIAFVVEDGKILKAMSNLDIEVVVLDKNHPDHVNQYLENMDGLDIDVKVQ